MNQRSRLYRLLGLGAALIVAGVAVVLLFQRFVPAAPVQVQAIQYSTFKADLKAGRIINVLIDESNVTGHLKAENGDAVGFATKIIPTGDAGLVDELERAGVEFGVGKPPSPLSELLLLRILPLVCVGGVGLVALRQVNKGTGKLGGMVGMGKSRGAEVNRQDVVVTFKDVGGADEAITELQEVIQFLTAPEKFARLGGRVPKGVLLVGPPGTGKTLLAKATAGEAGVRFFQTGGSEFMEMFVGVGAARVRSLFEQARKAAPAVVFIDEIDSIGQSRGAGGNIRSGANDEREQTLNQLLAEIDGFKGDRAKPVIIMAATNRPEVLDPALLRAGRFDRQVVVGQPDLAGRLQVLTIHSRAIKLSDDFDLERAARITPGFTGADLANVMNEAALLAARANAPAVSMAEFEAAIERVVAGLERKTRVMNEGERRAIAYHEAGHALVATLVAHADPVAKISIIPRGRGALGYIMQMPAEDRYLMTVEELTDRMAVMMGGRAAEQVILSTVTTGASDDIAKATELARRMVVEFGMSERLGTVRYAGQAMQFLEGAAADDAGISQHTRELIDGEVQRFVKEQYERAQRLLRENERALHLLTARLLDCESLDGSAVKDALRDAAALVM
ncbi:MAG TPA: ATP-dependent zinc metalloprotease FtsH [Anaerolineae bacterium]